MTEKSNLRFIPYGIYSLSKEGTMKNIILQHNMFLKNMTIVPIINIKDNEKAKIKNYSNPLFIFLVSKPQEKHPKVCTY